MQPKQCPEDDSYKSYCDIWDNFCEDKYRINHSKSQTHMKYLREEFKPK